MTSTDGAPSRRSRLTAAFSTPASAIRLPVPLPGSCSTVATRPVARIRRASTDSDPVLPPYPGTSSTGPGRSCAGMPAAGGAALVPPPETSTLTTTATTITATSPATPPTKSRRRGESRPRKGATLTAFHDRGQ